ncbi:hypothetical protein [Sulfurimonas marina]|uniref:Uncharacterized protein n=1 Tax=Sulfurimonas marina TaxID=2590551 RepID=A0A7M1AXX4_9BACT|nr:hypothetical protein [Sulfurimonas marina]QOP42303.1 hypothetical protein FJR03_11365 [Sulfurimonas marina]
MKFTLVKDLREDPVMKPILGLLLSFFLLYLVADFFVKYSGFGIFFEAVKNTLYGNAEEYLDPIDYAVFLEFWHTEIFFTMFVVFLLSTIFIRLFATRKIFLWLLNSFMISALLSLIFLPLSYFYHHNFFIYGFLFAFWSWHTLALLISVLSLKRLYFA